MRALADAVTCLSLIVVSLAGCGPQAGQTGTDTADTSSGATTGTSVEPTTSTTSTTSSSSTTTGTSVTSTTEMICDFPSATTGEPVECEGCALLDVLIVVDNSGAMADKQKNFVAAIPQLVTRLRDLEGAGGVPVVPDVHVMVTTTDVGHPLCTPFNMPGYEAAMGAPISTRCNERLERFTGLGGQPEVRPDVCLDHCPEGQVAAPSDPYVQFVGDAHNIEGEGVGDPVVEALKCVVPQGIDGCGMEAPLEAMLQALNPNGPWNRGPRPFLRAGAAVAIIILTDESDCSVKDHQYFDPQLEGDPEFGQYWEGDMPTSAICWNGSMSCTDADVDGVFEACVPADKGVLQPVTRYTDFLNEVLAGGEQKPVFMLVVAGLPETGIEDLVLHDWTEADLLPGDDESVAEKQANWGIGPGCSDPAVGYALPPGRIQEVCQALDGADEVRCCFQSTCATDVADGFDCLADALGHSLAAGR